MTQASVNAIIEHELGEVPTILIHHDGVSGGQQVSNEETVNPRGPAVHSQVTAPSIRRL